MLGPDLLGAWAAGNRVMDSWPGAICVSPPPYVRARVPVALILGHPFQATEGSKMSEGRVRTGGSPGGGVEQNLEPLPTVAYLGNWGGGRWGIGLWGGNRQLRPSLETVNMFSGVGVPEKTQGSPRPCMRQK